MTGQAERIREAHRGWRQAEPASRSRLLALETFGLRYVQVDDFNVVVEGEYLLNLALSYWRAEDNSCHGYLVSGLAAEIGRTRVIESAQPICISEKPAAARDSAARPDTHTVAEASAGHQSSSLLPVVMP